MSQPLSLAGPHGHPHGGGGHHPHGGGIDRTFYGGAYEVPYVVESVSAPSSGTFLDSMGVPKEYQNYVLIALAALALYGAYKYGSTR